MKYGEWTIDREYVDVQECDCLPMARCGCVFPQQVAWCLDMDNNGTSGVECQTCGATWTEDE